MARRRVEGLAVTRRYMVAIICETGEYAVGDQPPANYLEWHEWAKVQHRGGLRQKRRPCCGTLKFPQVACACEDETERQQSRGGCGICRHVCGAARRADPLADAPGPRPAHRHELPRAWPRAASMAPARPHRHRVGLLLGEPMVLPRLRHQCRR